MDSPVSGRVPTQLSHVQAAGKQGTSGIAPVVLDANHADGFVRSQHCVSGGRQPPHSLTENGEEVHAGGGEQRSSRAQIAVLRLAPLTLKWSLPPVNATAG